MTKRNNIQSLLKKINNQDDFIKEYAKHFNIHPLEIGAAATKLQDETITFMQNYIKNQKT